jgi:hypothetical protein
VIGLIQAIVEDNGKSPLGLPVKIGRESTSYKIGRLLYKGTTEGLKNYVRFGVRL